MALTAFTGGRIFTGERFIDGHGVLVDHGRILAVAALGDLPAGIERHDLAGDLLVPGFIDAQLNGGGGVLFNETPTVEAVAALARAHARHGTTAMLPTYITDTAAGMAEAMAAINGALETGMPGVAGIHLEGPFLSIARKGAHDPSLIRSMGEADAEVVLSLMGGTTMITVAPETVPPAQIRRLAGEGVIVSLGHTTAGYDAVMAAADAGARGITHLYNAMSPLKHRDPGVVGAALDHGGLWCGLIADGHHVHPAALSVALRAKRGPARLFLVTDAMPTAGHRDDRFLLNGRQVTRVNGMLTLDDGTLAGSDLTMDMAIRYAVSELDVGLAETLRMASLYPAQFLRLDATYGRIAAGYRADLVRLDADLQVAGVWIGGVAVE